MIAELVIDLEDLYPEDEDDAPAPGPSTAWRPSAPSWWPASTASPRPAAAWPPWRVRKPSRSSACTSARPPRRGPRRPDPGRPGSRRPHQGRTNPPAPLRPRQPAALRVYERNGYVRRAAFAQHREHETNVFMEKGL
uniref:Uncharacterized protein n=1 Tax=Phenylobacterium glaciei TaxID=2803784 RepID=A0A974P3J9_9CAUL|nr:hypothetical protein JKL49_23540 [Phenylobacterium glaciei]